MARTNKTGITKQTRRYVRKDGSAHTIERYRVRVEVPTPSGGREQRSKTVETKREAEAWLTKWRLEAADGGLIASSKMTVGEIAKEWLDLARPRLRPKTAEDYGRSVRAIRESALGAQRVQAVTAQAVQAQYRAWADVGVGARSIELAHLRLCQIMDLAVKWKVTRDNPARAAEPAKPTPKPRRVWTEDEARRFLGANEGQRFHLLWSLILATGLRRGEALGLRWQDLDLDGETPHLRVRQTVEIIKGRPCIGEPKTEAAKRRVDLLDELHGPIAVERERARDRARFREGFDLVFCTHDGAPLNPNNVYKVFLKDIERADVPRITLHDLRRTFATVASARGVPIRELAAILGHAKPSVTLDIYAQPTRQGGREAVGRVGRALFG